ncbi:PTS glucose transporter subunit IIA [Mediterraneibacter glycyrrhizinilyticus]|uniref:PTS sugar transporter subunit IIA n=1 Tax=Mediterraneibacter glycyrrhizinilyticus TaxID=342942 RepID=UPI001960D3F6|nr:PTS glucose transporter subunit IIA [Mediterraneibacter glycyrrhizinilyticus]MBM6752212.1 PTS glucose transporter subunit IIA [Mediterraneibacter glycyrrhizinilyticus]
MAVAIVIPFTLTFIVGRIKLSQEDRFGKEAAVPAKETAPASDTASSAVDTKSEDTANVKELKSILDGKVMPIEEAPDDVFSQKIMGDGVAIEPSNTVVTAPADCDVSVVMADTGHACGLTLPNGVELLIHVGVDTVDMGGDGFKLLVNEGDHVKAGQPLIEFDPEKIKAAGHPCTTMLIVTAEGTAANITMHSGIDAKAGETTVISWD